MITSAANPKIKKLRALQSRAKDRREAASFVVEGVRLAEEASASGWPIKSVYFTKQLEERGRRLVESLQKRNVQSEEVSESVMKAVSDTKTPQGLLLEMEFKELPLPARANLVLILDGIAEPGNLGTLLRSAAAAGVDTVLLAPNSADPFSPKVLRAGMGAHFRLPVKEMNWTQIKEFINQSDLSLFLAEAGRGVEFDKTDLTKPLAFVIGSEARGISPEALDLNPTFIQIPMPGKIESLNAATAGSLLLFEALRQRRGTR